MLKLCLVNPPISMAQRYGALSHAGSFLPPLNVALLAAVARTAGHEAHLLDAEAMRWSIEETAEKVVAGSPHVPGLTATTAGVVAAGRVIEEVRRQALVRNVGTCRLDEKRDVQGRTPEDQRIDARHRDGATRSSDELGETPRERRGRVIRFEAPGNCASGRSR